VILNKDGMSVGSATEGGKEKARKTVETDPDAHSPADNARTHTRTRSFSREAIQQREMVEQQRKQALDDLKQHSALLPTPPSSVTGLGDIWGEADVDMTFYFILP
jgi:hypothetical protein